MEVKINVRGIDAVKKFLSELPRGTIKPAIKAFTEYLLGNTSRGLKHYEPYKFVRRKRAYGKVSDAPAGYFSWKQFRYVAWKTEGFTKFYKRTGATRNAWEMKSTRGGYAYTISNPTAGAVYTRHDAAQARQPALVGWRKAQAVIAANIAGAMKAANAAVNAYIKSKK